jgi:hypothetical protein
MDPLLLIVQILGGSTGGQLAGSRLKSLSSGSVGNWLAGMVGGMLGGNVVNSSLGITKSMTATGVDPGVLLSQLIGSGIGGGLMMILVGMLRQVFAK